MSQKQLQRYQVVSMAVEGRCTVVEAARALGVSPRQIKRLKRAVRERGAPGVVHGNSQRASPRRTSERLRQRIIRLARSKYKGFNDTHMCEKLQELEGLVLVRETLRRILRQEGPASPKRHRRPGRAQVLVARIERRLRYGRGPRPGRTSVCGSPALPGYPAAAPGSAGSPATPGLDFAF